MVAVTVVVPVQALRKKGLAAADKKAGRVAAEGLLAQYIHAGSRSTPQPPLSPLPPPPTHQKFLSSALQQRQAVLAGLVRPLHVVNPIESELVWQKCFCC